jgi:hypothetical protein
MSPQHNEEVICLNPGGVHPYVVLPDHHRIPSSTPRRLAETVVAIASLAGVEQVACLGDMDAAVEDAIRQKRARVLTENTPDVRVYGRRECDRRSPCGRADTLFWAARLNCRGMPDRPLCEVRKSIRFGGQLVMWAPLNGQPDLAGTFITIEQLLHAASFDSIVAGRLYLNSEHMMVATALVHPVLSPGRRFR